MTKKIDMDFGERLKVAAERAGIAYSQTAIADFLSVRKQNVDSWMKGSLPRADQLFEMADKFGVDPRWFATGKQNNHVEKVTEGAIKLRNKDNEKLLALVKFFLDTDDAGRADLLAAAEAFKGAEREANAGGRGDHARRHKRR